MQTNEPLNPLSNLTVDPAAPTPTTPVVDEPSKPTKLTILVGVPSEIKPGMRIVESKKVLDRLNADGWLYLTRLVFHPKEKAYVRVVQTVIQTPKPGEIDDYLRGIK